MIESDNIAQINRDKAWLRERSCVRAHGEKRDREKM